MATYLEKISVSKEKKSEAELAAQAEDAGIQVLADISSAKKAVRESERELDRASIANPFSSPSYIDAVRALKNAKEDLTDLQEMKSNLFPTAV